jgi:hypothetical protein
MLEQFRVLQAALRLGEFMIGDLARESGVAEATVQKTLRRRVDLFSSRNGPPTGRRGGQPKIYQIKATAVQAALQTEADAIPLAEPPEPLGIALAEDTLLRMLPRSRPEQRGRLIAVVDDHLKLAGATARNTHANLFGLHHALRIVVTMKAWLADLPEQEASPALQTVKGLLDDVLSIERRKARDQDAQSLAQTVERLERLPSDLAKIATEAPTAAAPIANWWLELPAAVWALLGNDLWSSVAGDLTKPELWLTPRQPEPEPAAIPAVYGSMDAPQYGDVMVIDYGREFLSGKIAKAMADGVRVNIPVGVKPYGGGLRAAGYRREGLLPSYYPQFPVLSSVELADAMREIVRVHMDYSHSSPIPVRESGPPGQSGEIPSRLVEYFDFNFGLRRVLGVTLTVARSDPFSIGNMGPRDSVWAQYSDLRAVHGSFLRTDSYAAEKYYRHLMDVASVGKLGARDGICLWPRDSQVIQIRLNPGHAIGVLDYGTLNESRLANHDIRAGEVWWLDFVVETGQLISAHMRQSDSGALLQVPFDDLDYDSGRKCFVLRKLPSASQTPMIAAAMMRGIHSDPYRPFSSKGSSLTMPENLDS